MLDCARMQVKPAVWAVAIVIILYFPLKLYVLDRYHPALWVRLGFVALFWIALFAVVIAAIKTTSLVSDRTARIMRLRPDKPSNELRTAASRGDIP